MELPTSRPRLHALLLALGCGLILHTGGAPASARPGACSTVQRVGPIPFTANFTGVAHENGLTVAVGQDGALATSIDGLSWTRRETPTAAWLRAAAWGAGRWVVVGEKGVVLTSDDAITFALHEPAPTTSLRDVTWGAGRFVAVGEDTSTHRGIVLTSADGVAWTTQSFAEVSYLAAITWSGSLFVAGGTTTGTRATLLSSPDGLTWQTPWTHIDTSISWLHGVAWANGQFVAVGSLVLTSTDGAAWTVRSPTVHLSQVAGDGNRWVAITYNGNALSSLDGVTWEASYRATFSGITWANDQFIAVGSASTMATTTDGKSWRLVSADLHDIASNGSSYVAMGTTILTSQHDLDVVATDILFSRDGVGWERATYDRDTIGELLKVTTFPGGYVAVGRNTAIRSADGLSWSAPVPFPFPLEVNDVTWGTPGLVLAGDAGWVATSRDGSTFVVRNTGTTGNLGRVIWDGRRYYAFHGYPARCLVSATGEDWEQLEPPVPTGRRWSSGIRWTGAEFVKAGESFLLSHDAETWTEGRPDLVATEFGPEYRDVVRLGDGLLAVGHSNSHFYSPSSEPVVLARSHTGAIWEVEVCAERSLQGPSAIAAGPGGWVAVGRGGLILHGSEPDSGDSLVPTVAHLAGRGGTEWRSDVTAANLGPTRTELSMALLARGRPNPAPATRTFTLDPDVAASYPDVVTEVFGLTGPGALRLSTPPGDGLVVATRAYNQTPAGTFGMDVPRLRADEAIEDGRTGVLMHLSESAIPDAGSRANLGLINAGADPIDVKVELFSASASLLGTLTVHLREMEPVQLDRVFARVTTTDVPDGVIRVSTTTPGGRFFAFASVVDNRSGDPILVTAR